MSEIHRTARSGAPVTGEDPDLMIRLTNVSKVYRLGEIGSGTLYRDLQSWQAKRKGLPDPNRKIGHESLLSNEPFFALKDIDLSVRKGECLGIIGGNGAGKSTLLKLISRVTGPSAGEIDLYGRVTSMLEVGTGFHGEMTGRENIYLNGTILGMSRKEIDAVLDEIIDFSEVRQFIDTPVKRYSSGMYVKLGFAVAAHLRSEIVIMDEVLAVGDIAFQKKCIQKMLQGAHEENRTVLYVSHNMNTVRDLCDRCIVLDHGQIIYDGAVEEAISYYSRFLMKENDPVRNYSSYIRRSPNLSGICTVESVSLEENAVPMGGLVSFTVRIRSREARDGIRVRMIVSTPAGAIIGMTFSRPISLPEGETNLLCGFGTDPLAAGFYVCDLVICEYEHNLEKRHDYIGRAVSFSVIENERFFGRSWKSRDWGSVRLTPLTISEEKGSDPGDPQTGLPMERRRDEHR